MKPETQSSCMTILQGLPEDHTIPDDDGSIRTNSMSYQYMN